MSSETSGGPSPRATPELETLSTERASAMPVPNDRSYDAVTLPPPAPANADAVAGPLVDLQSWFLDLITHPESATAGHAHRQTTEAALCQHPVESLVKPGDRMTAMARMEVYHFAYHARLIECLIDDYPALQHALGAEAFEALARRYIEHRPSTHPNLNLFGRHMPDFCGGEAAGDLPNARFLSDLARLEWAMVEVLHAAEAPALSLATLQRKEQADWGAIRLVPTPSLQVLDTSYPVNRYLQAFREGQTPEIPTPEASWTAVYRVRFRIWRMDLTPPMASVLTALLAGRSLEEALETLSAFPGTSPQEVMIWFREWVEGHFFADEVS